MTSTLLTLIIAAQLAAVEPKSPLPTTPPDRVEIVLVSAFQCPFCAHFAPAIRALQANGLDDTPAAIQFKNFPLSMHPNSQLAHQAALAAREQGKFWEMHDLLFANQSKVQREDLL